MSSRVFITGVAGFLGSHLAERMLQSGHEVVGCDNMIGGYEDNVPAGIEFHKSDARDAEKMKTLMKRADVLYHCAASPYEGLSVFSPGIVTDHTYNSTVGAVSAAVQNGVGRIVFCSSMARYGHQDTDGGMFHEEMRPAPVDPYGVAKYASELFIETMAEAHGFEYVIAVPHSIYGPKQKYDDPYRNVISIMINRMLCGKQPIIYGDGEQKRSFTFYRDAIDPLEKLGFQQKLHKEAINIGPDEEFITINDMAKILAKIIGFKLDPIYVAPRPLEVKNAGCLAHKARKLLGYETTTSFEEGARELVEWIDRRGAKPFTYHIPLEIINDKTPVTWKDRTM